MKSTFKFFLLLAGLSFMTSIATANNGFEGTWAYSVKDTPNGDYQGEMTIAKDGDTFSGVMKGEGGSIDLKNVKVEGDKLTFMVYVEGYACKVSMTRDGDSLKGGVSVEGETFPMTGTRK